MNHPFGVYRYYLFCSQFLNKIISFIQVSTFTFIKLGTFFFYHYFLPRKYFFLKGLCSQLGCVCVCVCVCVLEGLPTLRVQSANTSWMGSILTLFLPRDPIRPHRLRSLSMRLFSPIHPPSLPSRQTPVKSSSCSFCF